MTRGLLLDSHVLLWLAPTPPLLPSRIIDQLRVRNRPLFVSVVGVAELCIKSALGKLALPIPPREDTAAAFEDLLVNLGIQPLPLTLSHAARLRDLPRHHGDPFDRLMIAQAMEDDLTFVTHDRAFAAYEGLAVLWV